MTSPVRKDGYAPIADYALIGDGRTAALVARDGAIDWLCLPDQDSPSVFGALLDAERGGSFRLAPTEPFECERRYLPGTNVLETTFRTAGGTVRVTDALTTVEEGFTPLRELVRRVEGLSGRVDLAWRVEPRFRYAAYRPRFRRLEGAFVAEDGATAIAVSVWHAGRPERSDGGVGARFAAAQGSRALLSLAAAYQEPLVLPSRDESERRLDATIDFWRAWLRKHEYAGPWEDAVRRSVLALKLLLYTPSGAVSAAPTTSLPETIGGARNWDYRFSWIRDTAFTFEALLRSGCREEARAYFWWLMHASQITRPRLQPFYRLNGGHHAPERIVDTLAGYRASSPVRVGNGAVDQRQLDVYGSLLDMVWIYVREGGTLDPDTAGELAEIADLVCDLWRCPDKGIWEVRSRDRHFTHSKVLCWTALDRACRLARRGELPDDRLDRWDREVHAIREFVETRCWSERRRSYVRYAACEELDASLFLIPIVGFCNPAGERVAATVDAILKDLGRDDGPFILRYAGEDGLEGEEGCFLPCSFWCVHALALGGRLEQAAGMMEQLLRLANDVGLFPEEIDPRTGAFLGNFPQGLTHLTLVNAAAAFQRDDP